MFRLPELGLFIAAFLITNCIAAFTYSADGTLLERMRQLTYDGKRSGEAYFSPDGTKLIFQSEREESNPFYQIYMMDFTTGEIHRVSPGTGKTTCAYFRPGHNKVLFASTHLDEEAVPKQKEEMEFRESGEERRYSWDYDEHMDIFSSNYDGSGLTRLTVAMGYDAEGAYSPDGSKIVFCSMRDAFPLVSLSGEEKKRYEVDPSYFGELYIMNADGSNPKRLTNRPGYDGGPFFSPDGKRIIWRAFEENGAVADIFTMKIDGTDKRQLTDFESMSWAPYFHPSQKYAIFASNKFGFANFELFIVDTAGKKKPVRVTEREGFDGLPVFSPDGTKLVWTSNHTSSESSQIFLAEWNHEAALAMLENAETRENTATEEVKSSQPQSPPASQTELSAAITEADLKQHVYTLASDEMEGRMTGSEGIKKAADYLMDQLKAINVSPLNDEGYIQPFEYSAGAEPVEGKNSLTITFGDEPQSFESGHFMPLSFSSNGTVEGEVVFAGYGLSMPGDDDNLYDSYAGLDVEDKIVLVLRYVPEEVSMQRRQELNRYAGLRYKAMNARERGAKGIVVLTGPNSPNAGELVPIKFDTSLSGSGIIAGSISGEVAQVLFEQTGQDLQSVQAKLDTEETAVMDDLDFSGLSVKITTKLKRIKKEDRNVTGVIHPHSNADTKEFIMIGGHYDHIGYGETGSLAGKDEEGMIHNGADDNASGTSVILELAAKLQQQKQTNPEQFQRGVIFAFWSGEELGLIGSSYFADNPLVPLNAISAYLNFDMVGRLRDNKLSLQGIGSSSVWKQMAERKNILAGFQLNLVEDPYLPTDSTAFYPKEIPILSFFTGSHEDYNRPTDDPPTLNYEGMKRIGDFAYSVITDLIQSGERPDYQKVERQQSRGGSRDSMRVYLGTIPEYTQEVEGVLLSGVGGGGPADKAGIKGGDIIVELEGQTIKNIYDYTYALDALKVGEPANITIKREGKTIELKIVPTARK